MRRNLLIAIAMLVALSPVDISTAASTVTMKWVFTPGATAEPGTRADADSTKLSDGVLDSSFVAQVLVAGKPAIGRKVVWSVTDKASSIQARSTVTDSDGYVRSWYFAGGDAKQLVSVKDIQSGKTLSWTLTRKYPSETVAPRYVYVYFNSPQAAIASTRTIVKLGPAPAVTYYSLINQGAADGGSGSVYGGLQQINCTDYPKIYPNGVCSKSRGAFAGRVALFSAWELVKGDGSRIQPVVQSQPAGTQCQHFGNEGEGTQCFVLADWAPEQTWFARLDALPGAASGWTRVRATYSSTDSGQRLAVATYDIPYVVKFNNAGVFVEDWAVNSRDCLQTESRSLTVKSVEFWDGTEWLMPTSAGANAYVNECFNFRVDTRPDGLSITSGGKTPWFDYSQALNASVESQPGARGLSSAAQSVRPWFSVPLTALKPGPQ